MDNFTKERITIFCKVLNERLKRVYLASEAKALGRGGVSELSKLTGVSRTTISAGMKDYDEIVAGTSDLLSDKYRIRKEGGGRNRVEELQPGIEEALLNLVDSNSYGNPENPLRWTTKSTRNLSSELQKQGFKISNMTVGRLLHKNGFTLQENRKLLQVGKDHPDRDAQFRYINDKAKRFIESGQPVISVDCKKKEKIGNLKNPGADWHEAHQATPVNDHDFEKTYAAPYGVLDYVSNEAFVNVGISADTAEFAVTSIRGWWYQMGKQRYPDAKELFITADGGGSNGSRNRLWKSELQKLSDELGIEIHISHFPPGTSKWNKIEHKLFSQISKNWKNQPLETYETVVNLIEGTTTHPKKGPGLKVAAELDEKEYEKGIKISDEQMSLMNIGRDEFHGNWNYWFSPSLLSPLFQHDRVERDHGNN